MKILQKTHKRIIGVLLFVTIVCTLFGYKNVYAQPTGKLEDSLYCKAVDEKSKKTIDAELAERYGFKIKKISIAKDGKTGTFELSMNPPTSTDSGITNERRETTFTLTSVNGVANGSTLAYKKPVTFTASISDANTYSGLPGVIVKIDAVNIPDKENSSKRCYYRTMSVTKELTFMSEDETEVVHSATCPDPEGGFHVFSSGGVDCKTGYTEDGDLFKDRFCTAKARAEANEETRYYRESFEDTKALEFNCNYNLNDKNAVPTNAKDLEGDKYFVNKHYLINTQTKVETYEPYKHEFVPGVLTVDEENTLSCKITCEEAVVVEYGPPVAAVAGMCFEYRVRVTSYVSCTSQFIGKPDPTPCSYTTPSPSCTGSEGTHEQGGPNEEFDACVQKCDGGKYTKKCSNKCYKQVYGSSVTANAKINNNTFDLSATLLADEEKFVDTRPGTIDDCLAMKENPTGCYWFDESNKLVWKSSNTNRWFQDFIQVGFATATDHGKGNEGRWYAEKAAENPNRRWYAEDGSLFFLSNGDGFWRKKHTDYSYCDDVCTWHVSGCTSKSNCKVYINPGYAERDYAANAQIYNDAVDTCKAKTQCSTNYAEFSIDVKYSQKDGDVTIHFPYTSLTDDKSTDKLGHGYDTSNQKNTTLQPNYPNEPSAKLDSGLLGCYGKDDNTNLYRATWGFPGSWRNLKTNETSYKPQDSGAWYKFPEKFCLPGDAKSVNEVWWNAYQRRVINENNLIDGLSISRDWQETWEWQDSDSDYNYKCLYYGSEKDNSLYNLSYTKTNYYVGSVKNNIHAYAKNFGYFDWQIQMNCFYAINNEPTNPCDIDTGKCSSGDKDKERSHYCSSKGGYEIRAVDQSDMFPNPDGKTTDVDEMGRRPGFNWSVQAINKLNSDYQSNPSSYRKKLQREAATASASGKAIYSNSNLDYEFTLTPSILRQMRKDKFGTSLRNHSNYTAFDETKFDISDNGVSRYVSERIRSLGNNQKIPNNRALNCNNMKNYSSSLCDTVHNS